MSTTTVKQARDWADRLIAQEMDGAGDTGDAMRRVARRYGVPFSALWALRYRPPKDVFASVYLALFQAQEAMRDSQSRKLANEYAIAKATGAHPALLRAAARLGGVSDEGDAQ